MHILYIEEIQQTEQEWESKTLDVINICKLMESIENIKESPQSLFIQCPDIVERLSRIEQQMQPETIKFVNSIDLNSQINREPISFEELKLILSKFVGFTDFKTIQYFK